MFTNFGVVTLQNQISLVFSNPTYKDRSLQICRITAILKIGASHLFSLSCSNIRRSRYLNYENHLYFAKYQFIHRVILPWLIIRCAHSTCHYPSTNQVFLVWVSINQLLHMVISHQRVLLIIYLNKFVAQSLHFPHSKKPLGNIPNISWFNAS